jgi:hypothetical protein
MRILKLVVNIFEFRINKYEFINYSFQTFVFFVSKDSLLQTKNRFIVQGIQKEV